MNLTHAPLAYRCPFCAIARGAEASCVVAQSPGAIAVVALGQVPTNKGGLLVFPKAHFESLLQAPDDALSECMALSRRVAHALVTALNCEGITLRQNNGPASGQDVWHFHIHVVPRWKDDLWGKALHQTMPESERAALAESIRGGLVPLGEA